MPPPWLGAPDSPPPLLHRLLPPASPPSPIKPLTRLEPGPSPAKLPLRAPVKRKGARGPRPQAAGSKRRRLSPAPPAADTPSADPLDSTPGEITPDVPHVHSTPNVITSDVPQVIAPGAAEVQATELVDTYDQPACDNDATDDTPINNDAPDSTTRAREPNNEEMYMAFMHGVDGEFISFIRIMKNWCVVQGWDSSRRKAVLRLFIFSLQAIFSSHLTCEQSRWYHLHFARIGGRLSVACKCPMSDHIRTMCVHEQYLREFEAYFSDEEADECGNSKCCAPHLLELTVSH